MLDQDLAITAERPDGTPGMFGPPVQVSSADPVLARLVGLTDRDPGWQPG